MKSISKKIRQARPRLKLVAPLTAAICWGYVWVNLLMGLGMVILYRGTIAPIAVASLLSYPQWGVLFLITALIMLVGLVTNSWKLAKEAQLIGLFLKTVWLIALVVRCFSSPQTILITVVWGFLTYVQAMTYIHFMPQLTAWGKEIDKEQM